MAEQERTKAILKGKKNMNIIGGIVVLVAVGGFLLLRKAWD